jgi:hypothetical protein
MKKIFLAFVLLTGTLLMAQLIPTEVYDHENYSIIYPQGWKVTNDSEIVNTPSQIGAITISQYHGLNLPKSETKKFILALYKSSDDEKKVISKSGKKDIQNIFTNILMKKKSSFGLPKSTRKIKTCT